MHAGYPSLATALSLSEIMAGNAIINIPASVQGRAGIFAIIVGLVLVVTATWALVVAPEGVSVSVQNRTGRRQYELGRWVLYIAPFLAFFLGWCGLRPTLEGGPRRPALIVVVMTCVAAAWQWTMISEVLGG